MASDPQMAAALRSHKAAITQLQNTVNQLMATIQAAQQRPITVQEEIDATPGRRIESTLSGEVAFTTDDIGKRATPIIFQVSQDGPFIQTHYPLVSWYPSLPDNTTNFGRWRPVSSYPLPDQVLDTDIIDIKYELDDGGSQRFMQNAPRGLLLSRPDNIVPQPIPTQWAPNAAIVFRPTYLSMTFNSATPPTQGILHVDLIGYRIVNL